MLFKNTQRPFFLFFYFFMLSQTMLLAQVKQDSLPPKSTATIVQQDTSVATLPSVVNAKRIIRLSLAQANPIILRTDLADNLALAQQIAVATKEVQSFIFDPTNKQPYRVEVFGVYPARASDFRPEKAKFCQNNACYRVEIYNYATNQSLVLLVNIESKTIIDGYLTPHTQPDIPPYLRQLALQIACESPEIAKALGFRPSPNQALMADTKTALNRSRCERSKHLCVAPTFIKGDKALWAIVDLTDLRLVGLRWTNVGTPQAPPPMVTERKVQNEQIMDCYCRVENKIDRNQWQLNYMLTSSDGLRIADVFYKGKKIVRNAKLVDWHVSYANTDGFGYSDAVGCPYFSTAAVIAIEPPRTYDLYENEQKSGFVLSQNFYSEGWPTACNYNYQQRYEFYDDGRFRVSVASLGRGCGNNGTYRPVIRVAFEGEKSNFSAWKNNNWQVWEKEQWQLQNDLTPYTPEGYQYKISSEQHSFYVMPGNGQFHDGGRGDNAYTYITRYKPDADEGESDLVTIGPCCNTDYHQGPEKFIEPNPDAITDANLVFWYVPQLKNDDREGNEYCWAKSFVKDGTFATKTFPCWAGPMFVPVPPNEK
jgi:hypothetical protein